MPTLDEEVAEENRIAAESVLTTTLEGQFEPVVITLPARYAAGAEPANSFFCNMPLIGA